MSDGARGFGIGMRGKWVRASLGTESRATLGDRVFELVSGQSPELLLLFAEAVEQDGGHDDDALDDELIVGRDHQEIHAVVNRAD